MFGRFAVTAGRMATVNMVGAGNGSLLKPEKTMKRINTMFAALAIAATFSVETQAQIAEQAYDPSARIQEVMPADVAERVLAKIAAARSRGLPTQALERTALKGAARQAAPSEIERAVEAQAVRLERSSEHLTKARSRRPSGDEIEAGAEAMRQGVDGSAVSKLASSAPSGRSLAVPLHVLGALAVQNVHAQEAIDAVIARLGASDAEMAELPKQVAARPTGKPAVTGRDLAGTKRPGTAGGAPAGVPANGGATVRPTVPVGTRPVPPA